MWRNTEITVSVVHTTLNALCKLENVSLNAMCPLAECLCVCVCYMIMFTLTMRMNNSPKVSWWWRFKDAISTTMRQFIWLRLPLHFHGPRLPGKSNYICSVYDRLD